MLKSNKVLFLRLSPAVRIILVIQAICMLMGTYTHVSWTIRHGFLYPDVALYSRLFWDSLTFLDPLAAVLLFVRPRTGVWLVAAIICVDVVHNAFIEGLLSFGKMHGASGAGWRAGFTPDINFLLQMLFCAFVLSTLRFNLHGIRKKAALGPASHHP